MINARKQIANLLLTVCDNVTLSAPDDEAVFPLICYSQTSCLPVNIAYDRLRWRVACYANTMNEVLTMEQGVIDVMSSLGFTLMAETSDENAHKGTDFYLKRLDFAGLVNKKTLGVLRGTT